MPSAKLIKSVEVIRVNEARTGCTLYGLVLEVSSTIEFDNHLPAGGELYFLTKEQAQALLVQVADAVPRPK